jgi:type I restriction enzyme M protein
VAAASHVEEADRARANRHQRRIVAEDSPFVRHLATFDTIEPCKPANNRTRTEPQLLEQSQLAWIANFIWGIADDVLRDLYVRGKYRDVILPMTVLRRLDAVLEPTKPAVIDLKASLDKANVVHQDQALRQAAGQAFYNTSRFTLRDLKARSKQQQLKSDFEEFLDGFSPNVQDILEKFEFRNQIPRLSKADALGSLIEKFLSADINLSPNPVLNPDGSRRHPGLDNHGMGTIFEELVRRFNEENNEEAGEHWTPRDAVKLMANLIFLPIAGQIQSGTYLLYDGACGTGGMLTVAEETLQQLANERGKDVATHLYGQEINPETYAICKADLLLQGEGDAADNIVGGPEHSTLSNDAFPRREFDFMLSNPPYGKSWKSDLERMGGKEGIKDQRFVIEHAGDAEYSLVTRSSDGQMLFLANMLSKMKHRTGLGSRIAEVHNGSSLFSGDAGQGESNIRRWVIENDWLEAIVALPLNMFYNTGIATYIWVLTNRKPAHRKGRVQLIDATQWFRPLEKNLGRKNCELSEDDIQQICSTLLRFEETEQSKIFENESFGYWKVTVERPLRLRVDLSEQRRRIFRIACVDENEEPMANLVDRVSASVGPGPHLDFNAFMRAVGEDAVGHGVKLTAKRRRLLQRVLAERDQTAREVFANVHKPGKAALVDPLQGRFEIVIDHKTAVVEYEPDSELRDTEQVPLLEPGGLKGFMQREVLPFVPDAWYAPDSVKTGYEISFTRYFYRPKPLRTLDQIRTDILALEKKTEGLLGEIIGSGAQ